MSGYRDPPSRADRAKAIAAVIAVHAGLAALVLVGPGNEPHRTPQSPTQLIDIALPPPPPPPPPVQPKPAAKPDREEGAAGKKAKPSPVVAPPARLPTTSPLPAAPIAGTGSASSAGVASTGSGTGAGGSGSGRGGGGSGGDGLGEYARLISGGLSRRDYRRLRRFASPAGRAVLALLVGPDGRVARCTPRQTSGDPALDAALCDFLAPRMVWAPARDRSGRPVTVDIYYTAIWSPD